MPVTLDGKVAVVTGGSRGIGAAIAKRLAAEGAKVAFTYIRGDDAATAVVAEIERAGGSAMAIKADAADVTAVQAAIEKTVSVFGGIDILVNNAGVGSSKPFRESTLEEIDRVIDVNVRGVLATTLIGLKYLRKDGRVINIGSVAGERAAFPGVACYAATKGAVKMFTQALSRELGDLGITVNNIQPGPIDTDMNPADSDWASMMKSATALGRYGSAADVAALAAFVAGPDASFITGANLSVDGGISA
jgi:3-oxoacyl-[acyl-carrier protein] reductase